MFNYKIRLIVFAFSFFSFIFICNNDNAYSWVDSNNNVRSDIIDGNHEGLDWVIPNGTLIAGVHTNIRNFTIETSKTVTVKAYDGTKYGRVEIYADSIAIAGTLSADSSGFGGGGGGGGSFGNGSFAGTLSEPSGALGKGGSGVAGGNNGGDGLGAWTPNHGNNTCFGGGGGKGGGAFGGAGGPRYTHDAWASKVGPVGDRGGYAAAGINGDATTNQTIRMGSGGGGAAGGTSQRTGPSQKNSGGQGSGGGGAGARGGGAIKLDATGIINITGTVSAKGSSSAGNGLSGGSRSGARGGNGGKGGSARNQGQRAGGQVSWEYPYGGYSGGQGGTGAGGGVLLHAGIVTISNNAIIDARGGNNSTQNGGTIKIFSVYDNYRTNRIFSGRLYEYEYKENIGYKVFDGTNRITIACEPEEYSISPLSIRKSGVNYSVKLVNPSHPKASKIKIQTAEGVKALQKY